MFSLVQVHIKGKSRLLAGLFNGDLVCLDQASGDVLFRTSFGVYEVFSLVQDQDFPRIFAGLGNGDLVVAFTEQLDAYTVADVFLPDAKFKRLQKAKTVSLPLTLGGISPIHAAALLDKPGIVLTLIEARCGLWLQDAQDRTALEYALEDRNYRSVKAILEAAALQGEATSLAFTTNAKLFEILAQLAIVGSQHIGNMGDFMEVVTREPLGAVSPFVWKTRMKE